MDRASGWGRFTQEDSGSGLNSHLRHSYSVYLHKARGKRSFPVHSHLAVTSALASKVLSLILLLTPALPAVQGSAHQQVEKGDSEAERQEW